MSEPYSRRGRRPDSRQMWDVADRNTRPGNRERERDRPRERDRDGDRERNQEYERDGDRPRDRDRTRKYRSRSRERRDKEPDKNADRPRDSGRPSRREDGRHKTRDRDRPAHADDGEREPQPPKRRGRDRDAVSKKDRRRSASPARSASPGNRSSKEEILPTRTRGEKGARLLDESNAKMSFKVSNQKDSTREDGSEPEDYERRRDGRKTGGRDYQGTPMDEDEGEVEVEDDGLAEMQAMMGFGGFGTTKNKKVAGNNVGGISKEKKSEYRQYMNRIGGFNRPLSPSR